MDLLENAPFNLGRNQLYEGVAGNLVAYACKISFQNGFAGYVSFTSKTQLIEHYQKSLNAINFGGHNIEPEVIERRYIRGIKNLFNIYLPMVDGAFIFDNSKAQHQLIADKQLENLLNIENIDKFNLLKNYYDNN